MKLFDGDLVLDTEFPAEIQTVLVWFNEPGIIGYLRKSKSLLEIKSTIEVENYFKNEIKEKDTQFFWMYYSGVLIGYSLLTGFKNKKCEFGVIIGDNCYWGKGIALQVSRLLLKHAFQKLKMDSVYATTCEFNSKALKALAKSGFKITGKIPEDRLAFHNSEWIKCSTVCLEVSKQDFYLNVC